MSQPLGQPVKATFSTFSDANRTTLADPTTATVYARDPATGTITTHVWPSGDLTHDSTGKFSWTAPDNVSGLFLLRFAATGTVTTSTRVVAISVDEAFPPMLVGLDDVKAETNITSTASDDELTTIIYTASAMLLKHPAYRVADVCQVQTYTDEEHTGGSDTIVLDHYPVTSITAVTEYSPAAQVIAAEPLGSTYTGYGYRFKAASGILIRTSGGTARNWCGTVLVTYTAGAASVPQDVRTAVLLLVDHLWETQRGTQGSGLPTGFEDETSGTSLGLPYGPSFALPNRVRELLEPYAKTPAVA